MHSTPMESAILSTLRQVLREMRDLERAIDRLDRRIDGSEIDRADRQKINDLFRDGALLVARVRSVASIVD